MKTALDLILRFRSAIAASGAISAVMAAVLYFLHKRHRKSDAERERDRRIALNRIGRMTDGSLTETLDSNDSSGSALIFYCYSISGVEYSAAQDVSCLRGAIPSGAHLPGETVIVKYDRQRPSNSIVICEEWSGLLRDAPAESIAHSGKSQRSVQ